MDLWQLKVFCKVVDTKSFSKAGGAVYLSQPTVSSHIKDLEKSIGCQLIDRLPKKAVPTKAGELLYGYAKKLLALRDEAETALAEFQGVVKGQLAIGGSTIPGVYILPQIVGKFTRKYPAVKISVALGDTDIVIDKILSGELELGVVGAQAEDDSIDQDLLFQDEMRLIVPASHKWAKRKPLASMSCRKNRLLYGKAVRVRSNPFSEALNRKVSSIRKLNVTAEMGSTEAVRQAVKAEAGVSIISMLAVSGGSLRRPA